MIELRSIHATAGNFCLDDINFTINSGDCHVIVGPTGAGKTLLLETIIGLRTPLSGSILIDDTDVSGLPPNERRISYVPQDTCLFPNMTVDENISYGLNIRKADKETSIPFVNRLVDFLHIGQLRSRFPQNLSGGEKQRVALVRALAIKPQLLVLDEPFSAIDHSMREDIRRMIKGLLEEFKTTTLIVTHDLDEAYFLGHRLSIIANGRIIQTGTREEIYYYPKTMAASSFLGIRNIFRGKVEAIENDEVVIRCDHLMQTIRVSCKCGHKRFASGHDILFGIRSEAVYILRPGHQQKEKECILDATVREIYVRGKMHTILVEVAVPEKTRVEIDIHDVAARKIGIVDNARIQISLNPKYVFLLPVPAVPEKRSQEESSFTRSC